MIPIFNYECEPNLTILKQFTGYHVNYLQVINDHVPKNLRDRFSLLEIVGNCYFLNDFELF